MSWRRCEKPTDEAKRLGVGQAIVNLRWSTNRLEQELRLSDSEKMFVGRVVSALQKAAQRDAMLPRLLHRDSSRGYTENPHLAVLHEPEAVSAEEQAKITDVVRQRNRAELEAEKARREKHSLEQRLSIARKVAEVRGIDIQMKERALERQIVGLERFLEDRGSRAA